MHKISKAYLIERIFDSLLFLSKKEIYKERKFPFFLPKIEDLWDKMREELCSSLPKIEDLWDKMRRIEDSSNLLSLIKHFRRMMKMS